MDGSAVRGAAWWPASGTDPGITVWAGRIQALTPQTSFRYSDEHYEPWRGLG